MASGQQSVLCVLGSVLHAFHHCLPQSLHLGGRQVRRMSAIVIAVQRLRPATDPLPLPQYMTAGAAGLDLMADITEAVELAAGARAVIPTGLAVETPAGFEAQIRPRSGLALRHGITLLNT